MAALVIGGGVVGIATARALAMRGWKGEIIVAEKLRQLGSETSSRNSGVIHAGLYYPQGSLMGQHCVRGKVMLYNYLKENNLPFSQPGKLIIGSDENDLAKLKMIQQSGYNNGLAPSDLRLIDDPVELRYMEPSLADTVTCALYSPTTGLVDQVSLMEKLTSDAEGLGVVFARDCEILSISRSHFRSQSDGNHHDGFIAHSYNKGDLECIALVNTAGLAAPFVANCMDFYPKERVPQAYYAKGNYFRLNIKNEDDCPFRHLVYPLPVPGGLGIHATLMLGEKSVRFGPDVQWLQPELNGIGMGTGTANDGDRYVFNAPPDDGAYHVDENLADDFYHSIKRWFPGIRPGQLQADYSGIRAKLTGPGLDMDVDLRGRHKDQLNDFIVEESSQHGVRGLVNMYGIQSPGLTSSLSLAESVAESIINDCS
jgi:L-2-hydroxyglutarate oxidase LhgO